MKITNNEVMLLKTLLENVDLSNLSFLKSGGTLIKHIKKGSSGIHIKKSNRGKFTEYCGGKVTNECIEKGKRSPNPTIRKRATFAKNARKWNK